MKSVMNSNVIKTSERVKKNLRNQIKNLDINDSKKNMKFARLRQSALNDIRKMNDILVHEEQKYRNLYESSPDLLRTINNKGIIIDCNKTYAAALGYSKKEIIGKSIFKHTDKKSHATLKQSIKKWKKTGKIINSEIWCIRKNGTTFPTLLSGTSLYDKNGKIVGRTVSLRDISEIYESKQSLLYAESSLREKFKELKEAYGLILETEEKYHAIYDSSPILYRTIDINGIILECNIPYAKALGYSKEEVIGKSIFDHVDEKSVSELKDTFHIWKTRGSVGERVIWLKRKEGTAFPVMLSAVSIYDKKGELVGSNTVLRDISDVYSAKQYAEEQKIKKLSAVGELSARIAHDMRNPLSVIKNAVSIIKMQNPNLDKKILDKFLFVDSAITRMSHQIDEVLDFVRPMPLSITRTTTTAILKNVMDRIVLPDTVKVNLPSKKISIMCDVYKMEVVLVNLITNAIQAMNDRGTISIRAYETKDDVLLDIEDTGSGITPEHLPKIFDPLFTTRQIGTGLGLVSCKSIIEKHNGTIKVKTVIGKGTTFIISIPKTRSAHLA